MSRRSEGDHTDEILQQCEAALEYQFTDRDLLRNCLTHASGAEHRLASNERLEFLGDAIMGAVVDGLRSARTIVGRFAPLKNNQ